MAIHNFFIAGDIDNTIQFILSQYNNGVEVFEFTGMTDLDISNLFAIVMDEVFDFDKHELEPLDIADEIDYEVFELPKKMLNKLGEFSKEELIKIAKQWAETEELQWKVEETLPILLALIQLSQSQKHHPVFFLQEV